MEHPGNSRVFLCYNKISPVKLSIKISCIASKIVYINIIIIITLHSITGQTPVQPCQAVSDFQNK